MYDYLADFIVTRRAVVIAITGVLFLAGLIAVPALEFDFTPQQLFESTDDAIGAGEELGEQFGSEDNVIVILVEGDDVVAPEVLRSVRDLTIQLQRHSAVEQAYSIATLALPGVGDIGESSHVGDTKLFRGPPVDDSKARKLVEEARENPLVSGRFVDEAESVTAVYVRIDSAIEAVEQFEGLIDEIEQIVDRYEFPRGVTTRIEGLPALRVTIVDELRSEQMVFIPVVAVVFLLALWLVFRRPSGVVLPVATVAVATSMTVAVLVLTDSKINVVNNVLPPLIFVIGIADSIHMLTRHAEEVGLGRTHREAVRAMIRNTGVACLLTTGTTAVGFLSLMAADTVVLRSFAWQAAVGVMLAYLATLFFLSAGLTWMQPVLCRRAASGAASDRAVVGRILAAVGDRILHHPRLIVAVGVLIAGVVVVQGMRVDVDSNHVLEVLSDDHPSVQATQTIEEELGGILPLEISLEAPRRDAFRDTDVYEATHRLQQFAARQKYVLSTESYVDLVQAARVAVVGDQDERDVMPNTPGEIEQLLMLGLDTPDADGPLSDYVTADYRNARVLVRVEDSGANSHLQLARKLEDEGQQVFAGLDVAVDITGDVYVASSALDAFVRDLAVSLGIAVIVIFGLMTLVFRSVKIGLVSLVPNCLPLLVTLGYMGVAGINLNSTTVVIFAIGLGIAVDDSIHFFARFREERRRRASLREAIMATYCGAGRAILLTSALLVIGMAILTFSQFGPTHHFGLLVGITIAGAVVADLLILPALLYLVFSRSQNREEGVEGGSCS